MLERRAILLVGAFLVFATAACAGDGQEGTPTLTAVGRLQGTDAFIWLASSERGLAEAYVCDGESGIADRFAGRTDGNRLELESPSGTRLEASFSSDEATGTLTTAEGESFEFTLSRAQGQAAFYFADLPGERHWAGWVVLADGDQRGGIRMGMRVSVAPELDASLGTAEIGGETFQVQQIQQFRVINPLG